MIVYHGSNAEFTKLDKNKCVDGIAGKAFYFSTEIKEAYRYGEHMYKAEIPEHYILLPVRRMGLTRCIVGRGFFHSCLKQLGYDGISFRNTVVLYETIPIKRLGIIHKKGI